MTVVANWWWTIARGGSRCESCREPVTAGELIASNAHGEVLCEPCAIVHRLDPSPEPKAA